MAGELTSRRGMIVSTEMQGNIAVIEGEVPLAETFGYSTDLRSMTQGQGTFTMEFAKYRRVPASASSKRSSPRRRNSSSSGRNRPRAGVALASEAKSALGQCRSRRCEQSHAARRKEQKR